MKVLIKTICDIKKLLNFRFFGNFFFKKPYENLFDALVLDFSFDSP